MLNTSFNPWERNLYNSCFNYRTSLKNAVLICMFKSLKIYPQDAPGVTCHPLIDCQNVGQKSWLNLPNCGFQPPPLVRPLPAWVNTFLFGEILSQAIWGISGEARCAAYIQAMLCLRTPAHFPGERGRKEDPGLCHTHWPTRLGSRPLVGNAQSKEAALTSPLNFSAFCPPAAITSECRYLCPHEYSPRVPPLSIYILLFRTDGWGCSLGLN